MRKSLIAGSIVALGFCGSAFAANPGFSYTYAELGYLNTELDDFDVDGDGFGLKGSFALNDRFHIFAGYADSDFDFDIGQETLEFGGGMRWGLSQNLDLVTRLSYVKAEVSASVPGLGSFSVDDDGFGLGAALRGRVNERFELTGGLNFVSFDEGGDDTNFVAGALYRFTDMVSAGLGADFNDDGTTLNLGVRFDFGR